jgi:zinc protease
MKRIIRATCALLILLPATAHAAPLTHKDKFLNIESVTSPGGITAWLVEDHTLPLISIDFGFKDVGAAYDPKGKEGLAQLASNTFDEGAGPYDSQTFQKMLADNSIDLHFGSSRDSFSGQLKTLSHNKDLAFKLMTLALNQPRFDAEPLARMKAANIARIKSSVSDPDWIAARLTNNIAFAGHPYSGNAGGTISGLKAITAADLKKFAKDRLGRDRLLVSAVGDITPEELKTRLDQMFGTLPAKAATTPVAEGTVQNGGTITLYKKDIPQTVLSIVQPGLPVKDPDYQAAEVMNFILGGSGFGSHLMDQIREKRGLTYGIYSGFDHMLHMDTLSISSSFKNENTRQVLEITKQQWAKMRDEPVSAKELDAAKAYMTGSMPLSLTSTGSIAGLLLGMQYYNRPIDYLDKRNAEINAVTVQDVQRVAQRILKPDDLTIILVGNPADVKPDRTIDTIPDVE